MKEKNIKKKKVNNSKYYKWGLTAFVVIMAVLLCVYVIYNSEVFKSQIKSLVAVLMPIIDGLIVAYLLVPVINYQERKIYYPLLEKKKVEITPKIQKLVRTVAVILTYVIVGLLINAFIRSVVPQLIESIQNIIGNMPLYMDTLIKYVNEILEQLDLFDENDVLTLIDTYYDDIVEFAQENVLPSVTSWGKSISSSVFSFLGALWDLLIGFIISVYILFSKEKFVGQAKKLVFSFFSRERSNLILNDMKYVNKTFSGFISGKIVDSIIIGLLCFIVCTICKIPYSLLVSVIVGVTNIIPFFGPIIGAIPCLVLIFLVDPIHALYFLIIVILLQQFDGNVLGPMILGNSTGLSGFWVIFSITLFGGLWGVPGMFLGVPVFACFYAWLRRKMQHNLLKKKLSLSTDEYINLKEIDSDLKFIEYTQDTSSALDDEKKSGEGAKNNQNFILNVWVSVKNWFVNLYKKLFKK